MNSIPALRTTCIALLSVCMIWMGYMREERLLVIEHGQPTFVSRERKEPTNYTKVMQSFTNFSIPPRLQSSILFSLSYLFMAAALMHLIAGSVFVTRLTVVIYLCYIITCFFLIAIGALGVDYRFSIGLSHYLEDLFLSPFFVLALVAVVKAFKLGM